MKLEKIAALFLMLCACIGAHAQVYEKQAGNAGQETRVMPEAFANSTTFLQVCYIGGTLSCPANTTSLGVRYTSGSAYSELSGQYKCVYRGSTNAKTTSPGYDLYSCGSGSLLPGFTIMVLVEGDLSTSYAGNISALYQP